MVRFLQLFNMLLTLAVVLVVCAMFMIKDRVQDIKYQLSEVNKQLLVEQDALNVLKAELTYLMSPARLTELSVRYLKLQPIQTTQLALDPLQNTEIVSIVDVSELVNKHEAKVKWRYKSSDNYIKTASFRR